MIVDTNEIPSGTTLSADLCVVGAGPAGLALASAFNGSSVRVALLEAGGSPGKPQGLVRDDVTASSSDFEAPTLPPHRFGGAANEWIVRLPWMRRGVRMLPLSAIDLEPRDWVPDSGWPIGWTELGEWYERAHRWLDLGPCGFDSREFAIDGNPPLPLGPGGFDTAMERFPRAADLVQRHWRDLRSSANVTVYLNAPVGELDGTVARVRSLDLDGGGLARLHVEAAEFVLATGGIENARLLLTARSHQGFGNQHDNVGRYFMDHLRLIAGEIRPHDPSIFATTGLYDIRDHGTRGLAMGKLVPTPELMQRSSLLNSGTMLLPRLATAAPGRSGQARHIALVARTAGEMAVYQRRLRPRTDAGWAGLRNNADRFGAFIAEMQVEQAPVRSNRVRLGDARNALGRPLADLDWRWSRIDLDSIRTTQRAFGDALQTSGIGTFTASAWDAQPTLTTPGGSHHPTGGTRMHRDPRRGVVDPDGLVHGVANLRVVGSSTFPTSGYANPTFTIIALALRTAERIRQTFRTSG